jgi:hypothetical protein
MLDHAPPLSNHELCHTSLNGLKDVLYVEVMLDRLEALLCTVRVFSFRQKFALEDAIGSHSCSLEALAGV